ncbi:hypothetical protein ACQ4PT_061273 [Festuca glaucescens]
MLAWRQTFLSAGMAGHGWGFALWIYDNFSRSPTSRTIGDTLLLLSAPEADTEYPFVDKLAVEDRAQPAEIRSLDLTRKEKTITSVFSRTRKGKLGPDNKMHNTNNKCTDDVAVARPVENTKECATSLAVDVNKKGSQVHKSLSTDNRDKPPSCSVIARPQTSGRKKKASKKDKHSTDSTIVPTKGKGDEGSNDGDNPTSSSQVVLYASRVEECAVDTALEETSKGRTKRSLPSKDSEKEALPAKRRRMVKSNNRLPSKDSEAASDKDHLMCQMSIQTIIDAADQLKRIPELIKSVRDAELKQELGFRSDEDITARKLVEMLRFMVNEHLESNAVINRDLALKLFYLILFNKGLCVGIAPRISSKEASMVKGLAYDKIRDMDFCQLVVDELQSSAIKWQGHEVLKYKYIEGLAVAPLIMYLDSLIYKDLAHMGKDTPRVLFLDEKNLTAISKADRNISAQKGNEDWVFGKIIDAETSNVIAEADAPDLETSAATISETSADMLAESLDPNDCKTSTGSDDAGCDISVVSTTMGEASTAVGPDDGQTLEDGQHIGKYPSIHVSDEGTEEENELAPTGDNTVDEQDETNVVSCHHDEQKQQINKETSGVQSESKENSNIAIEEDNPDNCSPEFATEPTMTTQDELKYLINNSINPEGPDEVSDGGYNFITDHVHEEICKYSTRSCITGNQDPSSRECMEKFRNQKFIQYGDTEVTIGELADSFEDGAPIKTNIMTIMVDVARSIMTNTKRLIVPFMAVLRCNRIQRNNDGNVNTRKLGNLVKAINLVDDSLLLDRYEIIKIPCFEEGDKNDPVGHYFVISVNLRRKRFELLDSLGGEGAEQHFVNTADVFKEIWKEAYKQSNGKLSPENLDDFTYEKPKVIPLQGATKRLLYLILMWEKLEVNFGLIETFHKDDFIKINSGEYKIIRKQTTVKPTMTVIVSLPDVNIPKPKEIDDGK